MKLNNKGFTLIEVLAVVVILAILGGVAISGVLSSINSSKKVSYDALVDNIKTAGQAMYEEVENKKILNSDVDLYNYKIDGSTDGTVTISNSSIITTLQTLVNNGYLTGMNNECDVEHSDDCANKNKKVIRNPSNNEDIGSCRLIITKNNSKYNVDIIDDNSLCKNIVINNSSDCVEEFIDTVEEVNNYTIYEDEYESESFGNSFEFDKETGKYTINNLSVCYLNDECGDKVYTCLYSQSTCTNMFEIDWNTYQKDENGGGNASGKLHTGKKRVCN